MITIWESLLLFLPLALVISIVTSTLRRNDAREIRRHAMRTFGSLCGAVIGGAIVLYFVMEWLLDH